MDRTRLHKLAGMSTELSEDLETNIRMLEITEEIHMGKHMAIDSEEGMEKLKKRMDAVRRALDIIPRIPDRRQRVKHLARVRDNAQLINQVLDSMVGSEEAA